MGKSNGCPVNQMVVLKQASENNNNKIRTCIRSDISNQKARTKEFMKISRTKPISGGFKLLWLTLILLYMTLMLYQYCSVGIDDKNLGIKV